MPAGVNWRQIAGVAMLGGIGFTMSIFIAGLAFTSSVQVADAKVGILLASIIAGILGYFWLKSNTVPGTSSGGGGHH
jgi:NhaA family Na+:H+ antiporter